MSAWTPSEGGYAPSEEDRASAPRGNDQDTFAYGDAAPTYGEFPDSFIDPALLALGSPRPVPAPTSFASPSQGVAALPALAGFASPRPLARAFGSVSSPAAAAATIATPGRSSSLLAGGQQQPHYQGQHGQQQQQQQQQNQQLQPQLFPPTHRRPSLHPYQQQRRQQQDDEETEEDWSYQSGHFGGYSGGQAVLGGNEGIHYPSPSARWPSGMGPDHSSPSSAWGPSSTPRHPSAFSPSRFPSAPSASPVGSLPQSYTHGTSVRPSAAMLPPFADMASLAAVATAPQAIGVASFAATAASQPGFMPGYPSQAPHAQLSQPAFAAASTSSLWPTPQGATAATGGPSNGHQVQGGLTLPPLASASAAPPAAAAQAPGVPVPAVLLSDEAPGAAQAAARANRRPRPNIKGSMPCPPGVEPAYWQRLYNRADWHTWKKVNKEASALGRESGETRRAALKRLTKAVVDSLSMRSPSPDVRAARLQLQQGSVRWTPNEPILAELASFGIFLAKSNWPQNPQNPPLPYHGEYSAALGFRWETNIDIAHL